MNILIDVALKLKKDEKLNQKNSSRKNSSRHISFFNISLISNGFYQKNIGFAWKFEFRMEIPLRNAISIQLIWWDGVVVGQSDNW